MMKNEYLSRNFQTKENFDLHSTLFKTNHDFYPSSSVFLKANKCSYKEGDVLEVFWQFLGKNEDRAKSKILT